MAELGAIKVRIDADTQGLESGMKRAGSAIQRGGAQLRQSINQWAKWGAAAAAAAAVAGAAIYKSTSRTIDQLAKTSDRLGIATDRLGELRFGAEQTGVAANTLDMGLQRMTRRISEAAQGAGEAKDAIKELGLDAQALARMSPDEQFRSIAEAMQGVANQGDRVRLAMRLFDSEGVALVNTMKGGKEALDAFAEEADRLGITLDRVEAAKVEQANDAMNRVRVAAQGAANAFVVELAPAVEGLSNAIANARKESGDMSGVMRSGLDGVVTAVGYAANAYRGWELIIAGLRAWNAALIESILKMSKSALQSVEDLVNGTINVINKGIFQLNRIPGVNIDFVGLATFESIDALNGMISVAEGTTRNFKGQLEDLANTPMPLEQFRQFVEESRAASEEAARVAASAVSGGGGEQTDTPQDTSADGIREKTQQMLKAYEERYASENELSLMQYAAEAEMLVNAKNQELLTQEEFDARIEQSYQAHTDRLIAIDKAQKDARLNMMGEMFSGLANLMNTSSKKLFKIGKTAAIAGAIVDAYKGISKTLAEYPYPFNLGFAAAHAATAFAQIQNIKKQQFGQAGTPTTFVDGQPAVRTTGVGGGGQGQSQGGGQNVNINLIGQSFGRDQVLGLIGEINKAVGDGVTLNTGA